MARPPMSPLSKSISESSESVSYRGRYLRAFWAFFLGGVPRTRVHSSKSRSTISVPGARRSLLGRYKARFNDVSKSRMGVSSYLTIALLTSSSFFGPSICSRGSGFVCPLPSKRKGCRSILRCLFLSAASFSANS